jgi:alkylhydroperoxidase family enzyme
MARILRIGDAIIYQNLLRIAFQSPKIGEAFAGLVAAQLSGLALSPKLRELLILHTAWRTQSEYAWTQHQEIAKSVGVTDAQIASIQQGQLQSFAFSGKEKEIVTISALYCGASSLVQ